MRVLFLADRLPHDGVTGGYMLIRQRLLRLAARGHEVGLAAFCGEDERDRAETLRKKLFELETVPPPMPQAPFAKLLKCLLLSVPLPFLGHRSNEMKRVVGNMVENSRYDVVVAEFSLMGQHLFQNPYMSAVRRVISCHHSATVVKEKALDVLGPSAAALRERMCLYRLKRFEFSMYRSADHVLVLTPQERFALLEHAPNLRISVVPNGVDTDYFQPRDHEDVEPCILFTGHYEDEPNEDAVLWFINSVWPSLKKKYDKLKFYVVGPNPTEAMRNAAEKESGVIITGFVDDIRTYLYRAQVFVCPIRMGAGMRGKILEAMASGLPVVSTTTGVEGIPAQIGDNCYLADRADIMAQMLDLLLSDLPLRQTIATRARAMVCERFDWEHGVSLLEKTLLDLMGRRI